MSTRKLTEFRAQAHRLVAGHEWYHQRFDGAPLYLYFIAEAEIARERRKPNGTEAEMRVSFFSHASKGYS